MHNRLHSLPDELIMKVYSFITPIYEYSNYVEHMKLYVGHKHKLDESFYFGAGQHGISVEQSQFGVIYALCAVVDHHLKHIQHFLHINPAHVRPINKNMLTKYQYKNCIDINYTENQIIYMDHVILQQRNPTIDYYSYIRPHYIYYSPMCDMISFLNYASNDVLKTQCLDNNIIIDDESSHKDNYRKYIINILMKL